MDFIVYRSSQGISKDRRPHPSCKLRKVDCTDVRSFVSLEIAHNFVHGKQPAYYKGGGEKWLAEGKNHRLSTERDRGGYFRAYRDIEKEVWCITLETLENLISFVGTVGSDVIISIPDEAAVFTSYSLPMLEIYDDYIE